MNYQERVERLQRMVESNQIIRNKWTEGNERACLLAALSPEAGEKESSTACPASVMPQWLAHLTPSMDDNGTLAEWPAFIRRYAAVAARWHVLTPEDWRRADHAVRALGVREAMQHTKEESVLKACQTCIELNDKAAAGEEITSAAWSAAESAALSAALSEALSAAWSAAESAAWSAAESAAWSAAKSAAWSAAKSAAWSAALSAALSAVWSAAESAAWSAAKSAVWSAAESAAWDRINAGVLSILENACSLAESRLATGG